MTEGTGNYRRVSPSGLGIPTRIVTSNVRQPSLWGAKLLCNVGAGAGDWAKLSDGNAAASVAAALLLRKLGRTVVIGELRMGMDGKGNVHRRR